MNIVVAASTFPRWENDTEPPFVFLLCKALAEKNHKLTVLAPHHPGAKFHESINGLNIYRFPYFFPLKSEKLCYGGGILSNLKKSKLAQVQVPFLFLMEFFYLLFLIIKEKPDVVHAHWAIPQGVTSSMARSFFKVPLVLSIHGSDVFAFQKSKFKKILGWFMTKPNQITVNSMATKKALEHGFGILHSFIVPMGIDINKFFVSKPKLKQELKILAVGRIVEQKGFQYLLDALPYILQDFPKANLTIIGDGPYKSILQTKVKENKLTDSIKFIGSISNDLLPYYYQRSDYFVGPSIMAADGSVEAFGVVFLEALACGVPVIASKVGGILDIIKDKYNGILVEQKNPIEIYEAIKLLEENKDLKQKLIDNGSYFVEEFFSWPKIAEEFEIVYKEALKK